ncbi:reduction in Cnn dots 6 isoform X2 [Lycorma delicatula]|uniref:reduction in Cnn dots 6 isoform X2 n=1 Tax=Lycorma delicatula TaxID=130591 RepID=UPI003F50D91A
MEEITGRHQLCRLRQESIRGNRLQAGSKIAYIIAFSMEMWWILQSEEKLPSLAHILCAVYLFTFIWCGFLLRGLSIRKTVYLLGWSIVISILSFPEAGLVIFMSIYYRVRSLYGLTELTCWICRVVVNIAGLICIQSLYSTWKEEKDVVRSLQGLHMKSLERPRRVSVVSNGEVKGGLGYQNAGFSASTTHLNSAKLSSTKQLAVPSLKRSVSSASQYSVLSRVSAQPYGGSLPYGINGIHQHPCPGSPFIRKSPLLDQELKSPSEFNASNFDVVLASAIRNPQNINSNVPLNRTQSMLNLSGNMSDLTPRKAMSVIDYPVRVNSRATQSLDRRLIRQNRASMSDLSYFAAGDGRIRNAYFSTSLRKVDPRGGILLPPNIDYRYQNQYPYDMNINIFYSANRKSMSRTSVGNESDDFQKYRDVAL